MKKLTQTWHQRKNLPRTIKITTATKHDNEVVQDHLPTDRDSPELDFGSTDLFVDDDFLREVEELERSHTRGEQIVSNKKCETNKDEKTISTSTKSRAGPSTSSETESSDPDLSFKKNSSNVGNIELRKLVQSKLLEPEQLTRTVILANSSKASGNSGLIESKGVQTTQLRLQKVSTGSKEFGQIQHKISVSKKTDTVKGTCVDDAAVSESRPLLETPGTRKSTRLLQKALTFSQPRSSRCPAVAKSVSPEVQSSSTNARISQKISGKVEHVAVSEAKKEANKESDGIVKRLLLSTWGLPASIVEQYGLVGVQQMFEWQADCLSIKNVLRGGNLVYSAPTSSGKTLVAELLMFKCILEKKKKVIFILPFVSVAHEKVHYLKRLSQTDGIRVGGYMGNLSPPGGFQAVDIAVCTIEKANGLVNRLIEEDCLDLLGMVVVDELHMVGDAHRGYLLELLLTKIQYLQWRSTQNLNLPPKLSHPIQIVGMSATLPNLALLAHWLKSDLFCTDFRPVPLTECIKIGDSIYRADGVQLLRQLPASASIKGDADHVIQLCLETFASGHGILVFCPTKNWCEALAQSIAKEIYERTRNPSGDLGQQLKSNLGEEALSEILGHLKKSPAGLDSVLAKTIPSGVAFHHAGLTFDERDIIEGSFRDGTIKILTATSTLSSGVNLPARRVIIRTPIFHGTILNVQTYKQMIGRAGRKGLDSEGESILICKEGERSRACSLSVAQLPHISSCLVNDDSRLGPCMKRALLEVVVSGSATSPEEVCKYVAFTLWAASLEQKNAEAGDSSKPANHLTDDVIRECLKYLEENEFIRERMQLPNSRGAGNPAIGVSTGTIYSGTSLGQAVLASSLPPDEGLVVFEDLGRARRSFVLENDLHIVYQVTPLLSDQWYNMDWQRFLKIWEQLPSDMKRVAECVGVEERFLVCATRGQGVSATAVGTRQAKKLALHLRFYTALALHDLINEISLPQVAEKFGCNRGMLQSLQQSAATFSGMVTSFCHQLGWSHLELLLNNFQSRLHFGIQQELCDLVQHSCLNGQRARVLFDAGYKTVAALANAEVLHVENILQNTGPFETARKMEGETENEANRRLRSRSIWLPGQRGVTKFDAAKMIIEEAREIVVKQLGAGTIMWGKCGSAQDQNLSKLNRIVSCGDVKCETVQTIEPSVKRVPQESCAPGKIVSLLANENLHFSMATIKVEAVATFDELRDDDKEIKKVIEQTPADGSSCIGEDNTRETGINVKETPDQELSCKTLKSDPNRDSDNSLQLDGGSNNCYFNVESEDLFSQSLKLTSDLPRSLNTSCGESATPSFEFLGDVGVEGYMENYESQLIQDRARDTASPRFVKKVQAPREPSTETLPARLSSDSTGSDATLLDHELNIVFNDSNDDLLITDADAVTGIKINLSSKESSLRFGSTKIVEVEPTTTVPQNQSFVNAAYSEDFLGTFESQQHRPQVADILLGDITHREFVEHDGSMVDSFNIHGGGECISSKGISKLGGQSNKRIVLDEKCEDASKNPVCENKHSKGELIPPTPPKIGDLTSKLIGGNDLMRSCSKHLVKSTSRSIFIESSSSVEDTKLHPLHKKFPGNNPLSDSEKPITIIDVPLTVTGFMNFINKLSSLEKFSISFACTPESEISHVGGIGHNILQSSCQSESIHTTDAVSRLPCTKLYGQTMTIKGLAVSWDKHTSHYIDVASIITSRDTFNQRGHSSKEPTSSSLISIQQLIENLLNVFRATGRGKPPTVIAFDLKEQYRALYELCSFFPECNGRGAKIASWLLFPNSNQQSLYSMVNKQYPNLISHFSSFKDSASKHVGNLGMMSDRRVDDIRARAATESAVILPLMSHFVRELRKAGLLGAFVDIEMPSVVPLLKLELNGIGFAFEDFERDAKLLEAKVEDLEKEAFRLAGRKFLLTSPKDIDRVLYTELNLPRGNWLDAPGSSSSAESPVLLNRHLRPRHKVASMVKTNKEVLQKLEHVHLLPGLIMEWRRLQSALTKVVLPTQRAKKFHEGLDMYRIHSNCETATATGRVVLNEPGLQMVPRDFVFQSHEQTNSGDDASITSTPSSVTAPNSHTLWINAKSLIKQNPPSKKTMSLRGAFIPFRGGLLVSADYSQLELRILAHLSGDKDLCGALNSGTDVFKCIAAKWKLYGMLDMVTDVERHQAKQMCYGMIYGIGSKALGAQLQVDENEASVFMESFKSKFPGIGEFIKVTVERCRQLGYVETLAKRRRYLPEINSASPEARSHAERQAVNSTVQGSAADLVKKALVAVDRHLGTTFPQSRISHHAPAWKTNSIDQITRPSGIPAGGHFVLELYDELVYETPKEHAFQVADIIKMNMEKAFQLSVHLPVNVKIGPSWGSLKKVDI